MKALCAKADDRRVRMESRLANEIPSPRKAGEDVLEGEPSDTEALR